MIKVKVCGITNVADALQAAELGAGYLGYILHSQTSPRQISPITAALIIAAVRRQYPKVKHVGVFVDATAQTINQIVEQTSLDVVQLHGQESPELIQQLTAPFVWKKISPEQVELYWQVVDGLLFDAGNGSGEVLSDVVLQQIAQLERHAKTIIVAGGITPNNVVDIISETQPDIIDVNSGVEVRPGQKDHVKLRQLFRIL